jgi:hypothetical protein
MEKWDSSQGEIEREAWLAQPDPPVKIGIVYESWTAKDGTRGISWNDDYDDLAVNATGAMAPIVGSEDYADAVAAEA